MAAILLRLELVSHGSTQAWNPSGGHSGEPDDRIVALIGDAFPHVVWRERYEAQTDDLGRERVITDATQELESWTRRVAPRVEGRPLRDLVVEDGEGFPAKIVAERFGVDVAYVRRWRNRAGRDTETGREAQSVAENRPERARELRRQGLSTRQIATILACHQTQVMRWIRDASVA